MGSKSSGGGGSTTTVQKADPWSGVQPWLRTGYDALANLYGTPTWDASGNLSGFSLDGGPQYYPNSTVADVNALEGTGQQMQLDSLAGMQNAAQQGQNAYSYLANAGAYGQEGANQGLQALYGMMGLGQGYANYGQNYFTGAQGSMQNMAGWGADYGMTGLNSAMSNLTNYGNQSLQSGLEDYWGGGSQLDQFNQAGGQGLGYLGDIYSQLGNVAGTMGSTGRDATWSGLGSLGAGVGGISTGTAGATQGMNQLLGAGDVTNNPYLQSAMNAAIRPLTEQYTEQVMPSIKSAAFGAGQMGSSRQGVAEGIASRGYLDAVADATAQMGSAAYGQGLSAVQAGAGIGQGLLNSGLGAAGQMAGLGNALQGMGLQGMGMQQGIGSDMAGLGLNAAGQRLQSGLGMYGMGMDASQALGSLGSGMFGQAGSLQNALFSGGIDLSQLGVGAIGQAGSLGNSMWDTGLTGAGRGVALTGALQQAMQYPGQVAEGIGQQWTADAQQQIDADMQQWYYNQNLPYSMMSDYLSLLNGASGGQTTSNQQTSGGSSNRLLSGLGGAATGYGLAASLFPGFGWAGALGGGLLGLF